MLILTDEMLRASGKSEAEIKVELAVWLYEQELMPLRKAAYFAGIHWDEFNGILKQKGITTGAMTVEDLEQQIEDCAKARNNA